MARQAWEWPWSSARAHATQEWWDEALDCRWAGYLGLWNYGEWKEILSAGMPGDECEAVRGATRKGERLGSDESVKGLERETGRKLRALARGRPKSGENEETPVSCPPTGEIPSKRIPALQP
jgi:hypothetical protein